MLNQAEAVGGPIDEEYEYMDEEDDIEDDYEGDDYMEGGDGTNGLGGDDANNEREAVN